MSHYYNDGSSDKPKLAVYLNTDNLNDQPESLDWPTYPDAGGIERLKAEGFEGLQITDEEPPVGTILPYCGLGRINQPEESSPLIQSHKERGDQCMSVHVGWGMESDREIDLLLESILNASEAHELPVFVETHRATITQDMWRTVEFTKRHPEILLTVISVIITPDREMPYGSIEDKFDFMKPIFERVGFMHGRIASPGHIQAPINETMDGPPDFSSCGLNYVEHFREMWTRSMAGFKKNAVPGAVLIFAPELLSPTHDYARTDKQGVEESDRYAQALLYMKLAKQCFSDA